ncbi:uncharacterized protein LOC143920410 [Arctopsyche grandis]|uniref:uncharacterized protein LOC143920410 n=1 Tax=Arctopsyche grandis TaxID=121162 RepID=UPI00406D9BF1
MGAHMSQPTQNHNQNHNQNQQQSQQQTGSGDVHDAPANLMPVDKLTKILVKKSHDHDGINGVTEKSFTVYLLPKYPELAKRLFHYFFVQSKSKSQYISSTPFRLQCEKFLGIMDDAAIVEVYVKMFCELEQEDMMNPDGLRMLLMTCYKLSMDHYSEGPQMCFMIHRTLNAVINSCFHSKNKLSSSYITRWLEEHCHRLVLPMHRYCVHILSTAWRNVNVDSNDSAGLELATPVLENPPTGLPSQHSAPLLPVSQAWLLAGSLAPLYSRPHNASSPSSSGVNLASMQFLSRLVCLLPSHWTMLYCSREHGLGANRFLHHVLAYRGPTLLLLQGGKIDSHIVAETSNEKLLICIAAPSEWRESHLYAGGPESAVLQLQPKFSVLEHAPKMLYLNTSIRGYPKGLRAGSDPRKPIVSIDEGFEKFEYRGLIYPLEAMEVWGCGDQTSRETQLDIKKWQVKEAERQRQVKLSASDWIDHPDRYLLELAGRPQYNNSSK